MTPGRTAASTTTARATVRAPWIRTVATTVAVGVFSSLFLPAVLAKAGRVVQDRQKERELKVAVSEGIVQPVTAAVTRARLFASGLIPAAAGGGVSVTYGAVLEEWLAASSKAGAQLDTYLENRNPTNDRLRDEWLPLFSAVTDYVRLSNDLEHFDRTAAIDKIQDSLARHYPAAVDDIDWANLRGPRTATRYYPDFHELGNRLLAARDALLIDVRSARLAGFSHHILDF
jgi:hypothetical protein